MKDEFTIGLNGKTIASFVMELKGKTIDVDKIGSFVVSTGSDEGKDVMNIRIGCILKREDFGEVVVTPDVVTTPTVVKETIQTPSEPPAEKKKMGRPAKKAEQVPARVVETVEKKENETTPTKEEPVAVPPKEPVVVAANLPTVGTNVRVSELAKLVKLWCKAGARDINGVTVDILKKDAFDVVENDSDETISHAIVEAKRLMEAKV